MICNLSLDMPQWLAWQDRPDRIGSLSSDERLIRENSDEERKGVERSRTAVDGFAIRCLATRPRRHGSGVPACSFQRKSQLKTIASISPDGIGLGNSGQVVR